MQDKSTGTDIRLSDEQVDLVNRLQRGQFGDAKFNEYEVRDLTKHTNKHSSNKQQQNLITDESVETSVTKGI